MDHVIPFDHDAEAEGRPQPGPTATWNLAPLCRFHHRLKTHTAWRYDMFDNGVFEWTSPHGHRYRRDPSGTAPIDPAHPVGEPSSELDDGPGDDPPDISRPRRR